MTERKGIPQPAPADIDFKCREYESIQKRIAELNAELAPLKVSLILMTETHGYVPPNAEKSKRLDGIEMVATTTTGSTIDIKTDAVTALQLALSEAKMAKLLPQLFAKESKYTLHKDASDILKLALQGKDAKLQTKLTLAFLSCFDIGTKAPSLSVDQVAILREREAEKARKAAAKAAKASKPKKAAKK